MTVTKLLSGDFANGFPSLVVYPLAFAALLVGIFLELNKGKKKASKSHRSVQSSVKRQSLQKDGINRQQTAPQSAALESGKQWKALYDAGLITREEYMEKLNRISG